MYLILFLVGVVLAFAGAVLIRYAVPVVDAVAGALFTSGIVAFVGGLILMGLAAAVRTLGRIAERLEIQPLPLPPVAAVGREDPAPRPARQPPAPAAAAAPRPSLLGWFGRASAPAPAATAARPPAARRRAGAAPSGGSGGRSCAAHPRAGGAARRAADRAASAADATAEAGQAGCNGTPETTVYKSGVIDGMAYTLFMDGSIEAELPQGKVRFASVDELQKYLTTRADVIREWRVRRDAKRGIRGSRWTAVNSSQDAPARSPLRAPAGRSPSPAR